MATEQNQLKTGYELLQMIEKIEPWIAEKIKINIKDQGNGGLLLHRYGSAQAMVRKTFVWGETKQGHEYWNDISHTIRFIK